MKSIWFSGAIFSRRSLSRDLSVSEDLACEDLCSRAFDRWGYDCPQYLNGEYALVIREGDGETVFGARDHIGAHPFFYSVMDGRLHCAGSIAELLRMLPGKPELDERYVATYLSRRRYSDMERTFFEGVFKLPPGHSLLFRKGRLELRRYWFPERLSAPAPASDEAYVEKGLSLLREAVAERVCDRVGVHVSGGLDSSAIAVLALEAAQDRGYEAPVGYAWHEAGPDDTDENLIDVLRRRLGIEVHVCEPDAATISDLLQDDPALGANALDLLHERSVEAAAVRQGTTTILSGWGGDEGLSFDGRGLARHYLARADFRRLRAIGRGGPLRATFRATILGLRERVRQTAATGTVTSFADSLLLERAHPYARPAQHLPRGPRSIQLSAIELGKLVPRLESWAESGRRLGIVYRYPLLDRRVLELALTIPPHLFRRGGQKRWLFRQMMEGVLPEQVRLHCSKREHVRVRALEDVIGSALESMGDRLGTDREHVRARFLDMQKLRRALSHGVARRDIRRSPLLAAIQFLDT